MRMVYVVFFWLFVWLGRPFGGIRPRRITHWLARKAYGNMKVAPSDFRWYRDRYGLEFLLHPHYHMDYGIIAFGSHEPPIANFIDKHIQPGMVCLDVGANIGSIGLYLARKTGPTGAVHCFEPVPTNIHRLEQHIERNNFRSIVTNHNHALANRTGKISMSVADPNYTNQGMGSIVAQEDVLSAQIEINAMTLDDFALQMGLERLDFAKIDIQGAEPLFLEGGKDTLTRFHPDLLMEVSPGDLACMGKTSRDLFRQIESLGYKIYDIRDNGDIGAQLRSDQIPENYSSDGVLCRVTT